MMPFTACAIGDGLHRSRDHQTLVMHRVSANCGRHVRYAARDGDGDRCGRHVRDAGGNGQVICGDAVGDLQASCEGACMSTDQQLRDPRIKRPSSQTANEHVCHLTAVSSAILVSPAVHALVYSDEVQTAKSASPRCNVRLQRYRKDQQEPSTLHAISPRKKYLLLADRYLPRSYIRCH